MFEPSYFKCCGLKWILYQAVTFQLSSDVFYICQSQNCLVYRNCKVVNDFFIFWGGPSINNGLNRVVCSLPDVLCFFGRCFAHDNKIIVYIFEKIVSLKELFWQYIYFFYFIQQIGFHSLDKCKQLLLK